MKLIKRFLNIDSLVVSLCVAAIVGLTGFIVYGVYWAALNPCLEKEKTGRQTCTSICTFSDGDVCFVHTTSCREVEVCTVRQMADGTIQRREPA